jgi:precorrin-6B methylase 2
MTLRRQIRLVVFAAILPVLATVASAQEAQAPSTFEPQVGQAGKDVVWVPTPQAMVDKMLDMAQVTPQDFLIDLGSGDGRTVIAAAKRGLSAQGIEYNPDMVELARRNATTEGVSERVVFSNADLFESDFSKAQVLTMFLLPQINMKLRPAILNMTPGTRVVSNSFTMEDWQPDQTERLADCGSWCTAHLWIVPAKAAGTWQLPQGTLTLRQEFQMISGTLGSTPLMDGRLRGDEITFTVGGAVFNGRVQGNAMRGSITGGDGGAFSGARQ